MHSPPTIISSHVHNFRPFFHSKLITDQNRIFKMGGSWKEDAGAGAFWLDEKAGSGQSFVNLKLYG